MSRIMRTPRVARETSRFFDASSTTVTPRRVTRSSLARFAYNGASNIPAPGVTDNSLDNADSEITFGSDIEDAIVKKTTPATRKRKRTATELAVVQPSPRRAPTTTTMTTRATTRAEIKTEIKAEEDASSDVEADTKPPRPRGRARKPARKTTDAVTGATTVEPPSDWEEIYSLVKEMRLTGPAANAAVDTMGCERLAHPAASARDRRFHTLVALMLSSQTKDTVNAEAMARLQAELPPHEPGALPGLTLENMLAVDPAVLNELIGKVGFHNNKTKYLKQTAAILRDKFNSDIPDTIEGLVSLPGVGPKMAHLCMSADNGWGRVEGIGVDVHVHRITNLWGWQGRPGTKTPEETRLALQAWLPRDKWKEINWLLVGFGQSVCLPVGPKCGDCELGLRGLCKAADRKKVNEGIRRRQRSVLVKEDERVKVEVVKAEPEPEPELERNVVGWEGMEGGGLVKCEEEDMEIDQVKEEKIKIDEIEVEGNADTESKQATKKGERVGDRENTPVIKKEEKIDVDDEEGMKITGESVVNTDLERAVTIKKEDEMAVDEAEIEVSGETDMRMEDKQAVKMEGEMEIDEVKPSVEDKAGDMECEQVIKNEEKMEVDEAKLKVKGERDENTESKHAIKREGKIEVGEVKPAVNGEGVGERDGELLMQSIEVDEVKVEVKGDMELGIKKEEGSMDIDEVKGGINVCGDGEVLVKKEEEKEDVVGWASHSSSYLREASARVKSEASRA